MDEVRAAAEAFEAGWRGELDASCAIAPSLDRSSDPRATAWALALRAQQHHAGLIAEAPSLEPIAAFREAPPEARGIAALAAALVARAALLAFDRTRTERVLDVMTVLERGSGSTRAALWLEVTRLWRDVSWERDPEVSSRLDALASAASRARFAELVIEANVLRAAAFLETGDLEAATSLARRVSRMARTEGMPQEEYLAHFFLARVRRLGGHAHLASRISSALWKVAPSPWRPWLAWELRLSGDALPPDASGPGAHAEHVIAALIAGQAERVSASASALRTSIAGFRGAEREAAALIGALDPRIELDALPSELHEWASGATTTLPHGLHSVVASVPSPHAQLAGHSWVLASPGRARRFLHPGIGMLRGVPVLEQTTRRHGRTEAATAVLALAGPAGIALRKLVPEIYGFPFSRDAHDGVLRVLLHRMRKSLEGLATIERDEDHVVLTTSSPFVVPDPRTSAPSGERVLRMIATSPGASARDIASALGIPLRTVQAVLASLVADGSCSAERKGGAVEYRLEDTTFSDPTKTGASDTLTGT